MNGPEFDELRKPIFSTYKIAICTWGRGKLEMGYFHNFKTFTGCFINSKKIMSAFNLSWKPDTAPIPRSCPKLASLKSKDSFYWYFLYLLDSCCYTSQLERERVYIKSIYFLVRRVNFFFFFFSRKLCSQMLSKFSNYIYTAQTLS